MTYTTEITTRRPLTLEVLVSLPDNTQSRLIHPLADGFTYIESTFTQQKEQDFPSYTRIASLKIWLPTGYLINYVFSSKSMSKALLEFIDSTIGLITHSFVNRDENIISIDRPDLKTSVLVTPPLIEGND